MLLSWHGIIENWFIVATPRDAFLLYAPGLGASPLVTAKHEGFFNVEKSKVPTASRLALLVNRVAVPSYPRVLVSIHWRGET